jgi:hypothetical protein
VEEARKLPKQWSAATFQACSQHCCLTESKGKRRQQDGTQDGAAAQDIVVALYLDKDCKR